MQMANFMQEINITFTDIITPMPPNFYETIYNTWRVVNSLCASTLAVFMS